MRLQTGSFLKSTAALNNTYFADVIIFIAEHNNNGAVGFVINKRHHRNLNELEEFKNSPAFALYNGGPVDTEHIYFIHTRPDIIEGGTAIGNGIYNGGNFNQVVVAINNAEIWDKQIKIFIGYCGWDAGELEEEIEEGSWEVVGDEDVFR